MTVQVLRGEGAHQARRGKHTPVLSVLLQWPLFFLDKPLMTEIICSVLLPPHSSVCSTILFVQWNGVAGNSSSPLHVYCSFAHK